MFFFCANASIVPCHCGEMNIHFSVINGFTALAGQALTADGVYTADQVNYAQIVASSDATMLQPLGVASGRPGVSPAIHRCMQ